MTQTLDRRTFIGAVAAGMIASPLAASAQTASLAIISMPTAVNAGAVFQATFRVTAGRAALLAAGPHAADKGSQKAHDKSNWCVQDDFHFSNVRANASVCVVR